MKVGDWAKYSVNSTWQSTDPSAIEPAEFEEVKKIEWTIIEVQDVSDTTISLQITMHYNNGTEQTPPPQSTDLATGFIGYVISGNLSEGDLIPGTAALINRTLVQKYADMNRTVNHLSYSVSFLSMTMNQSYYWDKTTGILCEMRTEMSIDTDSYVTTTSQSWTMIETNMWTLIRTALSCSISKSSITQGDAVVVTGSLNITLAGQTITLLYTQPDGSSVNRTVTTASDGSYSDSYSPAALGVWTITASWAGDATHHGAISSAQSFTVASKPFLETPLGIITIGGGILLGAGAVIWVLRKRRV